MDALKFLSLFIFISLSGCCGDIDPILIPLPSDIKNSMPYKQDGQELIFADSMSNEQTKMGLSVKSKFEKTSCFSTCECQRERFELLNIGLSPKDSSIVINIEMSKYNLHDLDTFWLFYGKARLNEYAIASLDSNKKFKCNYRNIISCYSSMIIRGQNFKNVVEIKTEKNYGFVGDDFVAKIWVNNSEGIVKIKTSKGKTLELVR
jgi:hypothetical protein